MHKIITLPHPSLRTPSRRVGHINKEITDLIQQMHALALQWEDGRQHETTVGLAAVQINQLWRVIIVRESFDDHNNRNFIPLINPEIIKYEGTVREEFEGCLSVANFYAKVPRHEKIRLKALDINGREIKINAEGFLAKVLQHEVDHIKGITIVDRVEDLENGFRLLSSEATFIPAPLAKVQAAGILKE